MAKFQNPEGFIVTESSFSSMPSVLKDQGKSTIFRAVLQEAEQPNRNKRIYGKDILMEALSTPIIREKLENKTFYGKQPCPSLQ